MTARPPLRNLHEVLRDGMAAEARIVRVLRGGPKTLPEIAAELGEPVREVTLWVTALRRYGRVHDVPKARADDYFRYELSKEESP
jgi:hypothetical protein